MQYPINEMFQTLQGEGYYTGVPAIFIRLQGCPVGCSWCDTKHTWEKQADRETALGDILVKTVESDAGATRMCRCCSAASRNRAGLPVTL